MKPQYLIFLTLLLWHGDPLPAEDRLDISDSALNEFLSSTFQYDYTAITDDDGLRDFINVLDRQLAVIEYRRRKEYALSGLIPDFKESYAKRLEERYRFLIGDRFIFEKLSGWREKSTDSINLAFIDFYLTARQEMMADPRSISNARLLARRIADRLYKFQFRVDGKEYSATEAAQVVASGENPALAHKLYRLQNDSAAMLALDAAKLYFQYNKMGEHKGYRNSLDYNLAKLSYRKPEWLKIADDLKKLTQPEFDYFLEIMADETNRPKPQLFEIERFLHDGAVLPDEYFTSEKCKKAIFNLLNNMGLSELQDRLDIHKTDSGSFPTVIFRLCPPHDNVLIESDSNGFKYYRRLAAELGRAMPWVFADTALPYMLRDYPVGSEEILTILFEKLALESNFLSENFDIPADELARFEKYQRWQTVFRLRQILIYFYFDYNMSNETTTDAVGYYASLEKELFGIEESSFHWIEILITGALEAYPKKLAHIFGAIKLEEMLYREFGAEFSANSLSGRFIIDRFCLPGKTQTIERFIASHADHRLSVRDFKRQRGLR